MIKETSIVETVSVYLDRKSFYIVKELPFLQRHVDIVGFEPTKGVLIAVEAKVKNWQSALQQAITCLLFADEVYIAMPTEYVHRVNRSELARFGIGLLEVSTSVQIVIRAISTQYASEHHRNAIIDRLHLLEEDKHEGECNVSH